MNFTIKQLRAFASVADLQSFSLAAQRMNLTPGAVSLLIRDLEIEVGFSLFDRTTRRVALSKAGREYLPAVQQVLRQVQAAVTSANDVKNRATGIVRVAAPLIVAHSMLPSAIAAYRQSHPDVVVRPVDCTVEDLVRIVEEDHADLAIGPDRPTSDLVDRIALYDSPWVLWCSPDHALARRRRITWPMLKSEAVIAAGGDYESRIAEALQQTREEDRFIPAYVVDNITTSLGIAAVGLGVTLSPMYVSIVARDLGLVMKRVEAPEIVREFSMFLPRRAMTPAATAFAEFLKEYLVSHQEGGRGRRRVGSRL
jgi:DNA-binding transcriptional LysR family regulator